MRFSNIVIQMAFRTSAIFLVKVIGFFARIMLFRLLGSEGIGLYQMAYSVYVLILTLIIGGFPMAISLLTAKDPEQGRRLFKGTAIFMALSGILMGFYCYRFAASLSILIGDPHLEFAIQCIAPALAIVPFLSLLRGYMQGMEYHGFIAVSEIIEQLFRIAVMIMIALAWLDYGVPQAVGGSMLGAPAGALISLCFMIIVLISTNFRKERDNEKKTSVQQVKNLEIYWFIFTSFSVLATRLIVPFSDFIDAILIPNRLQAAGLSISEAISVYGIITGMSAMIAYMPTLVTFALVYTLTPKFAKDWQAGREDQIALRMRTVMETAWLWGCGSSFVLFFFAGDLSKLIFSNSLAETGIRCMSLVPLLSGFRELSTGALWGIGERKTPLIGLIIGVVCSFILNYYFIAIPGFAYGGAAIGILSMELIAALWNLNALRSYLKGFQKGLTSSTIVIIILFIASLLMSKMAFEAVNVPFQSIGEMIFIYSCLTLYILKRFLKNERLMMN